jgi:hypothetical protein
MAEPTITTTTIQPRLRRSPERERLERRARLLAWGGIAYHFVEFAIAIATGVAASSILVISAIPEQVDDDSVGLPMSKVVGCG